MRGGRGGFAVGKAHHACRAAPPVVIAFQSLGPDRGTG